MVHKVSPCLQAMRIIDMLMDKRVVFYLYAALNCKSTNINVNMGLYVDFCCKYCAYCIFYISLKVLLHKPENNYY